MSLPSEDGHIPLLRPLLRRLGRWTATRFPRFAGLSVAVGRAVWGLTLVLAIVLSVGAVAALIGFVAQEMKKQGLTAGALVGIALGVLLLVFEWIVSWPGYVWLGLLAIFLLFRIESRLAYLAGRLSVLDRRTVKIGRALNALRGDRPPDYDDD